mmetsp:Transcript_22709/g.48197  ORF Transcript_22709/g.48197 Transcript_22709/m.48197 type:complete len:1074 (+) Transcript_22709:101-3322(+)
MTELGFRKGLQQEVDIVLGVQAESAASVNIATQLQVKGYCTIHPNVDAGLLSKGLMEIQQLSLGGAWQRVHPIVQSGLLGEDGSTRIAELDSPDVDVEARLHRSLGDLDDIFTDLHFSIDDDLDVMGIHLSHRTVGLVHKAGERENGVEPLTEKQVTMWMSQFIRHRLMMLLVVGPTGGTLELKPYATPDADLHQVPVFPGCLILLRPDLLSHRYFASGRSYVLSTFFLTGHLNKKRASLMIPPVQQLDEWIVNRLRQLKESEREDGLWNPDIPRDWQHAMNHMYHKGQMIAVLGAAVRSTSSDLPSTMWQASVAAPDYVTNIPLARWDHGQVYDDSPESWRQYKSYCQHGSFMDGLELFDAKFFNLTPNEAKSMDPHQRLILEVGYTALADMGRSKKTLSGSSCGVYVGCGNSEWTFAEKELEFGAFGATGAALSISSGRFSFILGLKGPSMTLDTEASSGASALYLAAESCQQKGRAASNDLSVAIAAHALLSPLWWPSHCASGWLSRLGRCLTFDSSADGFVRGDGVAATAVKSLHAAPQDKKGSNHDRQRPIGSIAGAMMNNNGVGASLATPFGPAEQEALSDALRSAGIGPCDIDAVEGHAMGSLLADAVEVGSLARALRSEDFELSLPICASKTSAGNQVEAGSLAGFIKCLFSLKFGVVTPNLHLGQLNPHVECFDLPCGLMTECAEFRMPTAFMGLMSRGFGGSNVAIVAWGEADAAANANAEEHALPIAAPERDNIYFWPGGGGELDKSQVPKVGYRIAGTWDCWTTPLPMEATADGNFACTVVLGENRWEQFQIWLDGDSSKALFPGDTKAAKGTPAIGPADDAEGCNWLLDGRGGWTTAADGERLPSGPDVGLPGDRYRIELRILGKWRSVTWEKEEKSSPVLALTAGPSAAAAPGASHGAAAASSSGSAAAAASSSSASSAAAAAALSAAAVPRGTYFVAGSFNNWEPEEMKHEEGTDGSGGPWTYNVRIQGWGAEFQILRNADWLQAFYPKASPQGQSSSSAPSSLDVRPEVSGPDDLGYGQNFQIDGRRGMKYRIEFKREVQGEKDTKSVAWHLIQGAE